MKFKSEVQLEALNNATVDTDKFLVSDSSTVKYRTGAQLLSDLGVSGIYVPYTGATGNVDLGTHTLSSYNLIVNHTSGSGVAASITKGGSGEALTINKTSGSGNAMSVTGGLTSLVDLTLSSITNATIDTDRFIVSDSGLIKYRTGAQVLLDIGGQAVLTNPITGTGTTNYVPKFTGTTTLGNSQIFDNGTSVLVGTTTPHIGGVKFLVYEPSTPTIVAYFQNNNAICYTGYHSSTTTLNSVRIGASGNNLLFSVSTDGSPSERMRIDSLGNVGIGTTSPSSKLDVTDTSAGNIVNNITVQNASNTAGTEAGVFFAPTTATGNIRGARITGIQEDGNNLIGLKFYTGSGAPPTEKMRITSAGNVGIGTTSPNYQTAGRLVVDINGTSQSMLALSVGGVGKSFLFYTGTDLLVSNESNGAIKFNTNGSEKAIITSSGNVGIGTTSPFSKLEIVGSATSWANSPSIIFTDNTGTINSRRWLIGNVATDYGSLNFAVSSTNSNDPSNSKMTITKEGNVGIGTTSPYSGHKLEVNGRIASVTGYGDFTALQSSGGTGFRWTLSNNGTFSLQKTTDGFSSVSATPIMIDSSNRVGIGNTTPSYPLHVSPQVSNVSIYADYDIVAYSDKSVKENIRPIDNALERVIESRGVLYDRIDSGEKDNIGFIAQELEVAFPELVVTNPDGTKAVKYQNAVAVLFEAVKEQQKQIDEIKRILNGLTN